MIVRSANVDEVRTVSRRRGADDLTLQLALESAESGYAWAALDDAEVVGLAIARRDGEELCIGDLFVEASFRGNGVGSRLLDAPLAGGADVIRSFLFDPRDAAATAMAVRRGLTPRESLLDLAGALPRERVLATMAAGDYRFDVGAIDLPAHASILDSLDRDVRGSTHAQRHRDFSARAAGQLVSLNGEPVAYAYCWPDGRIGPLAAASSAYLVQLLAFTMVTLQRRFAASWCRMLVPASNLQTARAALRAGLRIERTLALASDAPARDFSRYVAYHALAL